MSTTKINGREYKTVTQDMGTLPNLAKSVRGVAAVHNSRGLCGWLYTRLNGSQWVIWFSTGRKTRTEEVAA